MASSTTKSIICSNLPQTLLIKSEAKKYFQQFGNVVKLIIKPKSKKCVVDYDAVESAERALLEAGEYSGQEFQISFYAKERQRRKLTKKENDPDWNVDPEVQAELAAMGAIPHKNFTLRSEMMSVDSDIPHVASKTENRTKSKGKVDSNKHLPGLHSSEKELISILKQAAFTVEEKFRVLDARDKLLRLRGHNKKNLNIKDYRHNVGTCPDMCPEKERLMREMQHQIAVYEQANDRSMNHLIAVKQYSRSSADQESPLPHDLRNVHVLQMTMGYLMHQIMNLCDNADVNLAEWYHFLWDRTRGIRKDITQQELCCPGSVALVEQCARFHIHCSARLVAEDPSVFDQKINTENLTKCLQTLKYMYHDLEVKGVVCPCEAEFRAYIILLNLNDGNFMWEVQQLRSDIQKSKEIKFALEVYASLDKNNFVKFFKLVRSTTYLNACILLRYFIQVRVKALKTIVSCYTPRLPHALFPISELNHMLAFEGPSSTIDFLEYYGLKISEDRNYVTLNKRNFNLPDVAYTLDRAVNVIESKRDKSVGEVVCGHPLPPPFFEQHVPKNSFNENGIIIVKEFPELNDLDGVQRELVVSDRSNSPLPQAPLFEQKDFREQKEVKEAQSKPSNIFASIAQSVFSSNDNSKFTAKTTSSTGGFSWTNQNMPKSVDIFNTKIDKSAQQQELKRKQAELEEKLLRENQRLQEEKRRKEIEAQQRELQKKLELKRQLLEEKQRLMAEEENQRRLKQEQEEQRKKEALEKELERQRLILLEEKYRIEENRRRNEELRQKQEEMMRKKREEEALRIRNLEIQRTVNQLMNSLLDEVEENYKKQRLRELKSNILSRLVISRWKGKVSTNKRKRKAIDQMPLWFGGSNPKKLAEELYSVNQNMTLNMMKRYKRGKSEMQVAPVKFKVPKVDLQKLCGRNLLKKQVETKKIAHEIYYRVSVHVQNDDNPYASLIDQTLIHYFNWPDKKSQNLLEQHTENKNLFIYSVEQKHFLTTDDSNGLIIITNYVSDDLITKIFDYLNRLGDYHFLPVYFIIEDGEDHPAIAQFVENRLVSMLHVRKIVFNQQNLVESLNNAFEYLSENYEPQCSLQMNTLRAFLEENIGLEIWQRMRSFAKWNFAFKKCLCNPRTVISLFNEAIVKLMEMVFNSRCFQYLEFPQVFQELTSNKIPDYLPCDYRYFPSFWKDAKYKKIVLNEMKKLFLPEFVYLWPPTDQKELEKLIFKYCEQVLPTQGQKVFLKAMANILKDFNLELVNWLDVIEVLFGEILENLNYSLTDEFKSKTIFNQLIVVYEKDVLDDFIKDCWFYLKNPLIEKQLDLNLCPVPEIQPQNISCESAEENIDLDATMDRVLSDEEELKKRKEDLEHFNDLLRDLEDSVKIQKEISRRFQQNLVNVLDI